jgi:GNAT superfamily N-acetyltransferase
MTVPSNTPPVRLRVANAGDTEALSRLARRSKAVWGYSEEQLEIWKDDLTFTERSIVAWPTYVAEREGGETLGVAQVNPTTEPWELVALWVEPCAAGQGIGRRLLRQAAQVVREAGKVELAIDADPNAEGFYLACGAIRVGERSAPIAGEPGRTRPQLRLAASDA